MSPIATTLTRITGKHYLYSKTKYISDIAQNCQNCVHTDTSMSPGFGLQQAEASFIRVDHSRSLVQARN